MTQDIYNIASAFITDRDIHIKTFSTDNNIQYMFIKYGLADYPYCLTICAERKAPHKVRKNGKTYTEKHHGTINVKRGTAASDGYEKRVLLNYGTEHEVGSALDKTQSGIRRLFTRIQSPRFFKILNMAEKRIMGNIQTTNNSAQLYNMIYRIKENQK